MVNGGSESGMKPAIVAVLVVGCGVVVVVVVVERCEGAGIYGLPLCWWASELTRSVGDAVL